MAELKQVKLNAEVKAELDSLKFYENDSYSTVIKRLIEENKQLKEDKKQLYKLALRTEDSVALVNNVHKATYFIAKVVEDIGTAEEEKLQVLETYLNDMLKEETKGLANILTITQEEIEDLFVDKVD